MHLGGNRRWVPLSFENNNNNKRYPAHKFYFTVSSAASIQVHSRGSSGGGMFYSGSLRGNTLTPVTSYISLRYDDVIV